jgi:hypothetical protein
MGVGRSTSLSRGHVCVSIALVLLSLLTGAVAAASDHGSAADEHPGGAQGNADPGPPANQADSAGGAGSHGQSDARSSQADSRAQDSPAQGSAAQAQSGPNEHAQAASLPEATSRGDGAEARSPNAESRGPQDPVLPSTASSQADDIRVPPVPEKVNHDLTHTLRVERGEHEHRLSWVPNDASTRGYQVWRSNSPFVLIADLPADQTAYVDPEAPTNSKYKVTYYTEPTIEGGHVPASAAPASLPEWNAAVYVAAVAQAPVVVHASEPGWSAWIALIEAGILAAGVVFGISRPEASARAAHAARGALIRATARITFDFIVFGEAIERALRVRIVSRLSDHEILELSRFLRTAEAAPRVRPPALTEPLPRLTVNRLRLAERVES